MDFPLNSSVVLASAVVLWLLWVGPYFFRRPRAAEEAVPAGAQPAAVPSGSASLASPAGNSATNSSATAIRSAAEPAGGSQGNIMHNTSSGPQQGQTPPPSGETPASGGQAFRIRPGRLALALAGVGALLMILVGGVFTMFGLAPWWLPVAGLAVAVGAIAGLRVLAIRDRHARVDRAFLDAMGPYDGGPSGRPSTSTDTPGADTAPGTDAAPGSDTGSASDSVDVQADADGAAEAQPQRASVNRAQAQTVLFDGQKPSAPETGEAAEAGEAPAAPGTVQDRPTPAPAPAPAPAGTVLTAEELRAAARRVAAASVRMPPATSNTPWEPVEVPKPIYVEAPRASRPAPAPLVPPETPKPATKSPLRASTAVPGSSVPGSGQRKPAPGAGKINLDDVLQRRRA